MSDDNELMPGVGPPSDDNIVPEQSEPMSLSDDMGEPVYDIAGVALGAVSLEEAAEVEAAAAADPALAAELASMREVVAELARTEGLEMINRGRSAGMRSRLIARATASRAGRPVARQTPVSNGAAERQPGDTSAAASKGTGSSALSIQSAKTEQPATGKQPMHPVGKTESRHESRNEPRYEPRSVRTGVGRTGRVLGWLALAASIAFAAAATQLWRVSREHRRVTGALASRDTTLSEEVSQLQVSLATKDSVIAALTGPSTRVIDLASSSSLAPAGRMFWDQKTQQWTMYASHLKRPAPGKTYQLWLIASGHPAPISAGTFSPDSTGSAVMHAKYALPPGTLKRIAVTEEPDGGTSAPTGPIVFAGVGR